MHHVLVNVFLQVNANCPVGPDDFIGADARVGRNIAPWIWNPHVGGIVAHRVMRAFESSGNECAEKIFFGESRGRLCASVRAKCEQRQKYSESHRGQPKLVGINVCDTVQSEIVRADE